MLNINNKNKIYNVRVLSLIVFIFCAFNSLPVSEANISKASIREPGSIDIPSFDKELGYSFKVADKLNGGGEINLSIKENQITGIAMGLGNVSRYQVDFITNFSGEVDKSTGDIKVELTGEADPIKVPVPGKVSFKGPLKGIFENGVLKLVGIVQVRGFLASSAGFNKTEKVEIEIPDSKLYNQFMELKKLAS